jgi:phosphatidylserine decarboxylase
VLDFIDSVFPSVVWREYDSELQRAATAIIGETEAEELAGMVDAIKTHTGHDIPLSELEFLQIFYEVYDVHVNHSCVFAVVCALNRRPPLFEHITSAAR